MLVGVLPEVKDAALIVKCVILITVMSCDKTANKTATRDEGHRVCICVNDLHATVFIRRLRWLESSAFLMLYN